MDNIKFGEFIAKLRKENSMTQAELAKKLNVTNKAVSNGKMDFRCSNDTKINSDFLVYYICLYKYFTKHKEY